MNREKIMEEVRDYIDSFDFEVGEFGIAHHPLFNTFGTCDMENKNALVVIDDNNIERLKEQRYKHLKKMLDKEEDDGDLFGLFLMINKPYRIPVFMRIADELTKEQFSKILIDLWVDTEFPHENGVPTMIMNFERAEKRHLMDADEWKVYNDLPDMIVVYRGLQENAIPLGLSWTTSKDTAIWFASRFDRKGRVLKAKIPKKRVFAYKGERNEAEIILNPNYLKGTKEVQYEAKK
jgi:hypothetical protein